MARLRDRLPPPNSLADRHRRLHVRQRGLSRLCADYLKERGPIGNATDLLKADFLHLAQYDRNWVTWESWFQAFSVAIEPDAKGIFFDNYMLLIHAAVRGEGVALCGARLAEDLIERGELVRPFDAALPSKFSFYLLHSSSQPLRPHGAQFRAWLLSEAGTDRPSRAD